ncbi:hypothetical protein BBJ28_00010268 [Nothophytophthora sp. Chile5]|nr:hypothetical protein BBJ28_00010268 [Nothophytophthora sp. Chile5]
MRVVWVYSFSGTISLNAAIFTAVLLASRLQSNEHVFAFVLLAIEIFAMFPLFQREVKVVRDSSYRYRHSERLHLMTAAALFALSSALTWQLSGLLCVISGAFIMFLAFVCPLWFMHVQEDKKCVAPISYFLSAQCRGLGYDTSRSWRPS